MRKIHEPTGTAFLHGYGNELTLAIKVRTQKGLVYREYLVEEIPNPHPDVATPPAWRLTKPDGEFFDVHVTSEGWTQCTCASWVYTTHGTRDGCKHCRALRAVGLLT